MKPTHLVCAIAGGIILAYLAIIGGKLLLEDIAEGQLEQACLREAIDANYTEQNSEYPVTEKFAHWNACLDGYSYKRLPQSMKWEYLNKQWEMTK